jgi:hypothetical protein
MTDQEFTVIATAIEQSIADDISLAGVSSNVLPKRVRTTLKMEVLVGSEILYYEAEIPSVMMQRRPATAIEMILGEELREVDRRHQERLERRGIQGPWAQ